MRSIQGRRRPGPLEAGLGRRLLPFGCAAALALTAAAVPHGPSHPRLFALTVAMSAGLVVACALTRWETWPRALQAVPVYVSFGLIALARHAVDGSASGLSPLVLLPVVWLALYETRREVVISLVLAGLTIAGPLILVGAPAYTAADWRKAVIMTSVSALAAFVVSRAVADLAAQTRAAEQLAERLAISEANQRRIAEHDGLTGAANRRALDLILAAELPVHGGTERAVLMIDFDHFKAYNDTHGHAGGDLLLKEGVARWQDILREEDLVARYGGEEFAVLLRGCTPVEVRAVADRLQAATPGGQTVSIGVACARPGESPDDLLARADGALYAAKRAGRNRVVAAR